MSEIIPASWMPDLNPSMTVAEQTAEIKRVLKLATPYKTVLPLTYDNPPMFGFEAVPGSVVERALTHVRAWRDRGGGPVGDDETGQAKTCWVGAKTSDRSLVYALLYVKIEAPVQGVFMVPFDLNDPAELDFVVGIARAQAFVMTDDKQLSVAKPGDPEFTKITAMYISATSSIESALNMSPELAKVKGLPQKPKVGKIVAWPALSFWGNVMLRETMLRSDFHDISDMHGVGVITIRHRPDRDVMNQSTLAFPQDEALVLSLGLPEDEANVTYLAGPSKRGLRSRTVCCASYHNGSLAFEWGVTLFWNGTRFTAWQAVERLLGTTDRALLPVELWFTLVFLAQTADLDDESRYLWLRSFDEARVGQNPIVGAMVWSVDEARGRLLDLPPVEPYLQQARSSFELLSKLVGASTVGKFLKNSYPIDLSTMIGIRDLSAALWPEDTRQITRIMSSQTNLDGEYTVALQCMQALLLVALWDGDPPKIMFEPTVWIKNPSALASWLWMLYCLRRCAPSGPETRAWLFPDLFDDYWYPFEAFDRENWDRAIPLMTGSFEQTGRELVSETEQALKRVHRPIAGRYNLAVPPGMTGLARVGVTRFWVSIQRDGATWLRLVTADGGLTLPWLDGPTPPAMWQPAIPWMIRWEVHLLMLAFKRDLLVEGPEKIIFRAPERVVKPESAAPRPKGRAVDRGPRTLVTPRRAASIVRLQGEGKPRLLVSDPIITGDYATPSDRQEITRRLERVQNVKAHLFTIRRFGRDLTASEAQRAAFLALPLDVRLERFGIADLPPAGKTIRGLKLDPTGQLVAGYVRGDEKPDAAPRPVYATGLLHVSLLMRAIGLAAGEDDESD